MSSSDPHAPVSHEIEVRFYAELNDFLPPHRRQRAFKYRFQGTPSVKDTVEAIGVPHTEVDVILVDGKSVDFCHVLRGGERVAVYPVFEGLTWNQNLGAQAWLKSLRDALEPAPEGSEPAPQDSRSGDGPG